MLLDPARSYDLIGDVHGCGHSLEALLERLGYRRQGGVWRHPWRLALFVGDIVDRGPRIREALHLVHGMVEAGQALCVMGNHEYNLLGWSTEAPPESGLQHVREHTPRNEHLIHETLTQFANHPGDWRAFLDWFYELPLFVDAGRFRVVHACWDASLIDPLRQQYPDGRIDEPFLKASALPDSFAHQVFERLLRGINMRLPHGMTLTGRDGLSRETFRTKFWADQPQTYGDIVFQPDPLPEPVAQMPISPVHRTELPSYGPEQPPLFVGHYWRHGQPTLIRPNLACLDYSAVMFGKLVAYRLDQETQLDPQKFAWVEVERPETPHEYSD
ncbi:Calcineurin-like phosphoesterase [Azotobacter beijerinckii]|uniref:Calcineurin-like phosphoesterase n=1 Tax=Azotobacter beijerinckii TaxID=170623 RepID=A0A1H6Z8E6_9GAMM|nr:Calcineurin-like phosphoesterase [Azotobacter beijerinckii]